MNGSRHKQQQQQQHQLQAPFDFLSLPTELKRRTAYFLAIHDVLHLSQTCRAVQSALVLRRLQPARILSQPPVPTSLLVRMIDDVDNTTIHRQTAPLSPFFLQRMRIPVWSSRRVHSLSLQIRYQKNFTGRQGVAAADIERKICFCLSAYQQNTRAQVVPLWADGEDESTLSSSPALGRPVGCMLGSSLSSLWEYIADEREVMRTWRTTWSPQEGEAYYLWFVGGNILAVRGMELETRVLDDFDSVVSRQYTKLAQLGVLCDTVHNGGYDPCTGMPLNSLDSLFYPQLLLHVAKSLRQQQQQQQQSTSMQGSALVQFWQQTGLRMEPRDLAALEEILQADLEERAWRKAELADHRTTAEPNETQPQAEETGVAE